MAAFKRFEDIIAWQEARILCNMVWKLIVEKKLGTNYKQINQIDDSSSSIMDNIAEGFGRGGNKEFTNFLYIAKGSCSEVQSQLYKAQDRNFIQQDVFDQIYNQAKKVCSLIQGLINYLESSDSKGFKERNKT